MTYVYDLILNFNGELYDFYEWEKDDSICHVKRINLIKISSKCYNEILDNEVVFSNKILVDVFNKCEYFDQKKVKNIPYAFLITDAYRVMAVMLNSEGRVINYSSLLLDEEEDTLEISIRIPSIKMEYNILNTKNKNSLTRYENRIIKYIKSDLNDCYNRKDINKLRYLYYEYFNKENDDINYIYQSLISELKKELSDKHYNLYNLIKLSYSNKTI